MSRLQAKLSQKLAGQLRALIASVKSFPFFKTKSTPSTPTFSVSDSPPETPPPTPPSDRPTKVIIILLCYKNQAGTSEELRGIVNDLELLLKKFDYRHNQCDCFKILTDITLTFKDSDGVEGPIKAEYPTRENIKNTIRSAATELTPKDNCLIWYGGHADQLPVEGHPQGGALRPIDGVPISGQELRDWLTEDVDRWAPITLVLDACYTGNLLALPISYDEYKGSIQLRRRLSVRKRDNNIVVIAAAGRTQNAHSTAMFDPDGEKLYGVLTWVMLNIISDPNLSGTMVCTKQLYSKASKHWRQTPRITTTRMPNGGELAIFNLRSLTIYCLPRSTFARECRR